jgi:hypothetical protein
VLFSFRFFLPLLFFFASSSVFFSLQLAGTKHHQETLSQVDLASLPSPSGITNFASAFMAMQNTLALVESLSRRHTASSYFYRASVIQALFTRVLPIPLPFDDSKQDKDNKDSKDKDGQTTKPCLWANADITQDAQLKLLNLVFTFAKHYASACKSVQCNRPFRVTLSLFFSLSL